MNILDENIPEDQRQLLRSWRIRVRQVGHDTGRRGMRDEEIVSFLHRVRRSTFFTRDLKFYDRNLCHANYCLVSLAVGQYDAASFIRRFLRHPKFRVEARRVGRVIRVTPTGISAWRLDFDREERAEWPD